MNTWSQTLVVVVMNLGLLTLALGMACCLYRIIRGPHLADRAVAADALAVHLIGVAIVLSIRAGTLLLFDGILVLGLLGFAGTLAAAQYIARLARYRPVVREGDQP